MIYLQGPAGRILSRVVQFSHLARPGPHKVQFIQQQLPPGGGDSRQILQAPLDSRVVLHRGHILQQGPVGLPAYECVEEINTLQVGEIA